MSQHKARIDWRRTGDDFSLKGYTRDHTWAFDGGATVEASAAPDYLGSPERVDPELGAQFDVLADEGPPLPQVNEAVKATLAEELSLGAGAARSTSR